MPLEVIDCVELGDVDALRDPEVDNVVTCVGELVIDGVIVPLPDWLRVCDVVNDPLILCVCVSEPDAEEVEEVVHEGELDGDCVTVGDRVSLVLPL